MEKFFALPEEKQKKILDAGFQVFGRMGYKKASVSDIAAAAGISKAMIFHYFGNKKNMYLYLITVGGKLFFEAFQKGVDTAVTDFFDRIMASIGVKLSILKVHPALMMFFTSVYFERDPGVASEQQDFINKSAAFRSDFVLTVIDRDKFKETVKPELVLNILIKYAEGYVNTTTLSVQADMDALLDEITDAMNMMRNNFYKEEYL